jgi:hypothetical protein
MLSRGSAGFRLILGEFPAVLEVSRRILLSVSRTAWFAPDSSSRPDSSVLNSNDFARAPWT